MLKLASLIEIHYTVGILQKQASGQSVKFIEKKIASPEENSPEEITLDTPSILPTYDEIAEDDEQQTLTYTLEKLKLSETTSDPGDVGIIQQDMQLARLTEEEPPEDVEELVSQEISELEGLGVRNYKHKALTLTALTLMMNSSTDSTYPISG